jgi:hypothetical protein
MNEMKELLLEILENVFRAPDITATQQMGVQLSTAVKREGVVIIQNQNVEVLSHIVPLITKGLRLCDPVVQIAYSPTDIIKGETEGNPEILEIESLEPLTDVCKYFYQRETKWQDMQDMMRASYMKYVLSKFPTKAAAAKFLGVGPTYLCKLTKEEVVK